MLKINIVSPLSNTVKELLFAENKKLLLLKTKEYFLHCQVSLPGRFGLTCFKLMWTLDFGAPGESVLPINKEDTEEGLCSLLSFSASLFCTASLPSGYYMTYSLNRSLLLERGVMFGTSLE
jgi:hypothetical protein